MLVKLLCTTSFFVFLILQPICKVTVYILTLWTVIESLTVTGTRWVHNMQLELCCFRLL